jgi:hypothetical protein
MAPMRNVTPLVLALLLAACAAPPAEKPARAPDVDPLAAHLAQRDLELLMTFLEGTWETIPQAAGQGDSTPMRLRIARLWPERAGEYWVYAEYVNAGDDRQAIRQRIFRFQREGTRIMGDLYRVPGDPAAALGEWRKEKAFAGVNPASLKPIPGCRTTWLKQMETLFAGGTEGKACPGSRPEAVDEHSDFYVASSSIRTWIRGMDASGKQVEGPTGPSEFRKTALKPR